MNAMHRIFLALFLPLALAACQTPSAVTETEYIEVEVPVRAACPDEDTYATIRESRPVPLRDQDIVRPATPEAELAIVRPQLGRYEAPDAWADQAMRVIDSCHSEGIDGGLDPP